MRHKGVSAEETRSRITEAVGKGFRKNGYEGIGVDAMAKAAGVTSGAFYAHMGSKKVAFKIALTEGLDEVLSTISKLKENHGKKWLISLVEYYISAEHAADLECGCALASLTSEVARMDEGVCMDYKNRLDKIIEIISEDLNVRNSESRTLALVFLSMLIGGLNIIRAMGNNDEDIQCVKRQITEFIKPYLF
tara:strand:+ start:628 stop:1203 length:576 start_codon:yes stop_codon:yes gene_type:complete